MQSVPRNRGEMSQETAPGALHRSVVMPGSTEQKSRRAYNVVTSSAIGLELGVAVVIGALVGRWLDGRLGSEPWLMIALIIMGFVAGLRGVIRGARRAERAFDDSAEGSDPGRRVP
jgi:F0F1-type ATP synthase assembly protein I